MVTSVPLMLLRTMSETAVVLQLRSVLMSVACFITWDHVDPVY